MGDQYTCLEEDQTFSHGSGLRWRPSALDVFYWTIHGLRPEDHQAAHLPTAPGRFTCLFLFQALWGLEIVSQIAVSRATHLWPSQRAVEETAWLCYRLSLNRWRGWLAAGTDGDPVPVTSYQRWHRKIARSLWPAGAVARLREEGLASSTCVILLRKCFDSYLLSQFCALYWNFVGLTCTHSPKMLDHKIRRYYAYPSMASSRWAIHFPQEHLSRLRKSTGVMTTIKGYTLCKRVTLFPIARNFMESSWWRYITNKKLTVRLLFVLLWPYYGAVSFRSRA